MANNSNDNCASPNSVVPTLCVDGAAKAIDFYVKALGAKELYRMPTNDGKKILHGCIEVGGTRLFVCDVFPEMGSKPSVTSFYVYVDDVDAAFKKARDAGGTEKSAPQDMFWGDRVGSVTDAFGIHWTFAKHVRDVSDQEMKDAVKKMSEKAA